MTSCVPSFDLGQVQMKAFGRLSRFHIRRFSTGNTETFHRAGVSSSSKFEILIAAVIQSPPLLHLALSAVSVNIRLKK
jgi:hypothetical protein